MLEQLKITNPFADLGNEFCKPVRLSPLENPAMASWNPSAAQLIGMDQPPMGLVEWLNGNQSLGDSKPVASLYAGHQFGVWVQQLGDGRAAVIGQIDHPDHGPWELQLKGSGPTPFSRGSDGRAVLRSSIREYLCSEAMHGLGIPSTRALVLIDSSTPVYREEVESGALILRMAPTHIRFGSFEVFASRGQTEQLKQLADFVIQHFYPEASTAEQPYVAFYQAVVERTARLMALWQAQGFAHGVMNTDNMSILGLTIDYGPFGFMEGYNPGFICNHSDHNGRYAFNQQPNIGMWNLAALGNALLSLLPLEEAQNSLNAYKETYFEHYYSLMFAKLGIDSADEGDKTLLEQLLELMADVKADYSLCFRHLSRIDEGGEEAFLALFNNAKNLRRWLSHYRERTGALANRKELSLSHNPKYLLRNYMAQIAIDKARTGDYSEVNRLLTILHQPFGEHPDAEEYFASAPDWAADLSVSCSS